MLRASLLLLALSALVCSVIGQTPPSTCPQTGTLAVSCINLGVESTAQVTATESPRIFYSATTGIICGVDGGFNIATNTYGAPNGAYDIIAVSSTPVFGVAPSNKFTTTTTGGQQMDTFSVGFTVAITINGVTTTGNAILTATGVPNAMTLINPSTTMTTFSFSLFPAALPLNTLVVGSCAAVRTVGDPQFVGMRGQSYQIHGVDGSVYNIISDKNLQVNSKFVFLTEGQCPMFDGVADVNCWSHPGSYMGEMSFQAKVDGKLHAALLTSGSAKQGFAAIQMDGKNVKVGEQVSFGAFSLTAVNSHKVVISTEQFTFELTNSDMFINQALTPKVALSKMTAHGLLGQTHSAKIYSNSIKYIEGEVDDYVIADNDIFGDDFVYNQFSA